MGWMHAPSLFCFLISFYSLAVSANLETYIVHVELPESDTQFSTRSSSIENEDLDSWYKSFLPDTMARSTEAPRMVYSYHNVFKGFSAQLSAEDVKAMENKPGFISARPQTIYSLHTTHTPNFLGLHQNMGFWNQSNYGEGVIIGVLDTGIMPGHPSFGDEGMPPPPAKWKGQCEFNTSVCNNKLIGARFFSDGNGSPIDENGHGTHTAGTAAGNYVEGANVYGNANGTAVGIAPLAHLAIYKVCTTGCSESDILAAMDVAIDDGVDILSLSLGGGSKPFYADNIAIGAYSAMEKGIFVSCSAGNSGPSPGSLGNEAPWILTVGASSVDRKVRTTAVLGNNEVLDGESLYQPEDFLPTLYPLIYLGMNESEVDLGYCESNAFANFDVQGKIVLCDAGKIAAVKKGQNVMAAGGVGMIIINSETEGYTTSAAAHVLPATHLNYVDGVKVLEYIESTKSPVGGIEFKGTIIGDDYAPEVAHFSSRGPSRASPGILKPDIIGPGVNILAAWHRSVEGDTSTKSTFNVISGTSMSCPHLSGVAALLKHAHPDWSPAAIKSAMMTTTDLVNLANTNFILDERRVAADVFAMGSGHVNPSRANNPGLIYDIEPKEYIPYLCGFNYTNGEIGVILQRKVDCNVESSIPEAQLNYPSFSIAFKVNSSRVQSYTRTVTNVGEANSVYTVNISPPAGVNVTVEPNTLSFSEVNEKLTYEIAFSTLSTPPLTAVTSQGSITWKSAKYSVRSPIVAIMGGT